MKSLAVVHGVTPGTEREVLAELVILLILAAFPEAAPAGRPDGASAGQWPPVTTRPCAACPNRRLNAAASPTVRKQYRTVFSGRSTYMSHSKSHSSSQSNTSIAASSNDSATWYGKSRLISRRTLIAAMENKTRTRVNTTSAGRAWWARNTRCRFRRRNRARSLLTCSAAVPGRTNRGFCRSRDWWFKER